MLPHAIYFETLASITDESSQEWKTTTAGLFVLRLVDDWLEFGPHIVATDITGLNAVRSAIEQISEGNPIRSLLSRITHLLESAEIASSVSVAPGLLAYAQALQYDGQFKLEQDVLETLHTSAKKVDDSETVFHTAIRLGVVLRNAGDFAGAESYHVVALNTATAIGDRKSELRARLAQAKTIAIRGDIGRADILCAGIVEEAETHKVGGIIGPALHDRAYMAYTRNDFQGLVRFAHQALKHLETPLERDRAMGDIAAGFSRLGHVAAARDTNLILASCAQEQLTRWHATINLMYSAVQERQEDAFELYRAALGCVELPPRTDIFYHRASAEGFRLFGQTERAQEALQHAYEIAEKYQMQQLVFEIEEEMSEQPVGSWSPEIDVIADAMGEKLQFDLLATV